MQFIYVQEHLEYSEIYRNNFISLYTEIYSKKPYYEKFSKNDLNEILGQYCSADSIFYFAVDDNHLIGFAAGIPLVNKDKSTVSLLRGFLNIDSTFYNAEIAVHPSYRGKGVGSMFIDMRLSMIKEKGYKHVVMRTTKIGSMSENLYKKRGFKKLPVTQFVRQQRILENLPEVDERIFLCKEI